MELAQLKMVRAVAQTGSVAQAAVLLHCVPSNIHHAHQAAGRRAGHTAIHPRRAWTGHQCRR